jgi:hypothetical protein
MPRSQEQLHFPDATVLQPRFLVAVVAALSVGACQSSDRPRSNGIETGAIGDSARIDTGGASPSATVPDTAKPPGPGKLRVSNVMIGRGLGPDKRISEPTLRFGPNDTVFVSVATEGTPASSTLSAKWTFPTGKVKDSVSQTIQPKGAEHTELHAAPPKGGWPAGSFLVTVYTDGDSVDAKTFAVDRPRGADTVAKD